MKEFKNIRSFILKSALIVLLFTGIGLYTASAQVEQKNIIGTWTFDQASTFGGMDADLKTEMDTTVTFKAKVRELLEGRQVFFDSSGNYKHIVANGRTAYGTWVIESQILIITDSNGFDHKLLLSQLTPQRMVFEPMLQPGARPFIKKYYFTKN